MHYTAWITPLDGITRRYALISFDRDDALAEAQQLGAALFGSTYRFCVRGEA